MLSFDKIFVALLSIQIVNAIDWDSAKPHPVCKYLLSEWCDWSPCASNSEVSLQTREKKVEYPVGYVGPTCDDVWEYRVCDPDEVETDLQVLSVLCETGSWSNWGDCERDAMRQSVRRRTKVLVKKSAVKCEDISDHFVDTQVCNSRCSWESWSPCYNYNTGSNPPKWERYRERPVEGFECRGDWVQYQECTRCGEWGSWEAWSECRAPTSSDCGRIRLRGRQMSRSGERCEDVTEESFQCTGCAPLSSLFRKLQTTTKPRLQRDTSLKPFMK